MGCSHHHTAYIESAQDHEKQIRLFEEEFDLNTVNFYDMLSDLNYTFLHFNDLIPENYFDNYIAKKFKNVNVIKLFEFKEIRYKGFIKIDIVRYVFLLFCKPSIKPSGKNQKAYDKAEFILYNLLEDEDDLGIEQKWLNLLHLACKLVPSFFSMCNPSIGEDQKLYINQLQEFDMEIISYVLESIGFNEEVTLDQLNKKFEENPNVNN